VEYTLWEARLLENVQQVIIVKKALFNQCLVSLVLTQTLVLKIAFHVKMVNTAQDMQLLLVISQY
jgi:hypothetical protein